MPPPRQFLVRKPVVDEFQTIETSDLSRTTVVVGPGVSEADNIAVFASTDGRTLADGGMTIAEVIAAAGGFPDLTYLTDDDETADLPNSRQLLAGVNVAFDDTVPGVRTVNVASTSTVVTDPSGALAGDGSPGDPLAVNVDGVTVGINASNELEVLAAPGTVDVDPNGALSGDGAPSTPLAVQVDNVTVGINASNELEVLAAPSSGISVDPMGALLGDGTAPDPLGVSVDGVTVTINASNELESVIPNSGVTPGSYTNLNATIGADGRITSAANGTGGGGTGAVVRKKFFKRTTVGTGTTTVPLDDSIPQQSADGDEYMSLTFTPVGTGNDLYVVGHVNVSNNAGDRWLNAAVYRDSVEDAFGSNWTYIGAGTAMVTFDVQGFLEAITVAATPITIKLKVGANAAGQTTFNGRGAARESGGVNMSSITIEEVAP